MLLTTADNEAFMVSFYCAPNDGTITVVHRLDAHTIAWPATDTLIADS